ncbi:sensor histidine kinase [Priestia filamentosa]|uniref:ATP-binding protein n=1 Tax=Priestia filamentosa TaxID=1402861 RepID=UPI00397BB652
MLKKLSISWKITTLSYAIVLFSLLIAGIFLVGIVGQTKEQEIGMRSMNTARTVAELTDVEEMLEEKEGWKKLNPIIERLRIINGADYIVVMNMEHIRYSHPANELLGKVSKGRDEDAAFAEHIYLSKARGELGTSLRAFVPIKDEELNQIGVVLVGKTLPSTWDILMNLKKEIFIVLFITLLFGVIGSFMLARHIKNQMFKLEPHEIVRILEERTATFHALNEGVIAIDNKEEITIFNEKARSIFNVQGEVVGKPIRSVLKDTHLPEILYSNRHVHNQEIQMSGKRIFSNRFPIKVNEERIGAVAIFQDRTEVAALAEELTGVKNFVDALRVQNHEHMNKLHSIAGLIQLGRTAEALQFVFQISKEQEKLTNFLNEHIHHPAVSGLLLSKVSRGKELDIDVVIDPNSSLTDFPPGLDYHDFVILLGNLIENAFDALEKSSHTEKRIDVSIDESEGVCAILVEDNGIGIEDDDVPLLFHRHFTKGKESGQGIGLYLVKQVVDKGDGEIIVTSDVGYGTTFLITFPL